MGKRIVSLFTGCGGFDLGFRGGFTVDGQGTMVPETGFRTVFACDIKRSAKKVYDRYFKDDSFLLESVVDLVKRHRGGEAVFPDADIVLGGFPCQDFSVSGKRCGFSSGKGHDGKARDAGISTVENRGMLYHWMKEVVSVVRPAVFVAENVKGLVSLGDAAQIIRSDFQSVGNGYVVADPKVLEAIGYGVPQTRERVLFIGFDRDRLTREGLAALLSGEASPYPEPTHGPGLLPVETCARAFSGLVEPEESTDPSQRAFSGARYYGPKVQGQTEIPLLGPGPTIRSEHHGNIEFRRLSVEHGGTHLEELVAGLPERRLTVRECARLQTFPDDMEFVGNGVSATKAYQLVGNAVPPLLANVVARRLAELWPFLFGEKS